MTIVSSGGSYASSQLRRRPTVQSTFEIMSWYSATNFRICRLLSMSGACPVTLSAFERVLGALGRQDGRGLDLTPNLPD